MREPGHAHAASRTFVGQCLLASPLEAVEQAIEVPEWRLREARRPRYHHGAVELVREAQGRRVVAVETELVVRHPRRIVEEGVGPADQPTAGKPPVCYVGREQLGQLPKERRAGDLVVVHVQDPRASALRMQPGDD